MPHRPPVAPARHRPPRALRAALLALVGAALMALGSCGGTPQVTTLLTLFQVPAVLPTPPVAGQNYVVTFGLVNADEQHSVVTNVEYTLTRNNTLVIDSTTPLLTSHVPIQINFTDHQQSGVYTYVLVIDPNHLVPQLTTTMNTETFQVTVLPLTVM